MKKKNLEFNARQVLRQNAERMREIRDAAKSENRPRTAEEEAEYTSLVAQNQSILMENQIRMALPMQQRSLTVQVRDQVEGSGSESNDNSPVTVELVVNETSDLDGTGIIRTSQQDFIKPLRAGMIWDKVGIPVQFGLVGELRWPKHGKMTAKFVGEKEALSTQKIDWDKITMQSKRIGCAAVVTSQELFHSEGVVESIIREEAPLAIADEINAHMFATSATDLLVYGPFAKAGTAGGCAKVTLTTKTPTRKDLLKAKAKIAKAGISPSHLCWVMTEEMKAELESIAIDTGSGRFLCENDRVLGYPVFTTDAIGDKYIGLGDWSYQAAGFFGAMRFVMDPYTLSLNDETQFVFNNDFGTATLRPEAFVLIEMGNG